MIIKHNIELSDFVAWSGGAATMRDLYALASHIHHRFGTDHVFEILEECFSETFPEGIDATELNDILWFEDDWIAEMLGFEDYEEMVQLLNILETDRNHPLPEYLK